MTENSEERKILMCTRCGYRWLQRAAGPLPKVCASKKCKSPYWNRERIKPVEPSAFTRTEADTQDYDAQIEAILRR